MNENTNVPPEAGTLSLNSPSPLVTVPMVVPFNSTLTPGKAVPSSADVTFPETTRSCAQALSTKTNEKHTSKNFFIGLGLDLTGIYKFQIRAIFFKRKNDKKKLLKNFGAKITVQRRLSPQKTSKIEKLLKIQRFWKADLDVISIRVNSGVMLKITQ